VDGFTSLEQLYKRVKPALKSKCKDLQRIGIDFVTEEDIWNYLKENIWCKGNNLTLGEMVNDIMTLRNTDIIEYVQNIMKDMKREVNVSNN